MANKNYFLGIKETLSDYARQKGYGVTDGDITDGIKKAVEDVYGEVGRKVELIAREGSVGIKLASKEEIPFKSVFAITKPQYLIERAKYHIEKKIDTQFAASACRLMAGVIAKYQWLRFYFKGFFDKSPDLPELLAAHYKQSQKHRVVDTLQDYLSIVQNKYYGIIARSITDKETKERLLLINQHRLWYIKAEFSYLDSRVDISTDDLRIARSIFRRVVRCHKRPSFEDLDVQLTSTKLIRKPIKLNPEYDPEIYLKTVKDTINSYLRENHFHLEESDIYEAIKCAVEDICMAVGRKVVLDISVMPPKLLDFTNEDRVKEVSLTKIFAVIKPKLFIQRVQAFIDRFERGKIFATYMPYRGQIIKAEVMGETFFLGSRSYETVQVNKRFEGTLAEFGQKYHFYVESGKEGIVVHPKDYKMWDLATYIYDETGYAMSINSHRKILRLKKQSKDVIFNIFGTIGIMPADERIPGEEYTPGSDIEVILYDVNQLSREGYQLYVSRRQVDFLVNYITRLIPEFSTLKVMSIARDPGVCSKILVKYNGTGPIKWGQYKESLKEIQDRLSGEKIEIVEYSPDDMEKTIQSALNYEGRIKIDSFEKTATIITTNKGALIGKKGYNVRLAGMLTGFKFNVLTPDEYLSVS